MATRRPVNNWTRGRHKPRPARNLGRAFRGGAAGASRALPDSAAVRRTLFRGGLILGLVLLSGVILAVVGLFFLFLMAGGSEAADTIGWGRVTGILLGVAVLLALTLPMAFVLKVWWGVKFSRAVWIRLVVWSICAGLLFIAIGVLPDGPWKIALVAGMLMVLLGTAWATPAMRTIRAVGILIVVIAFGGGFALDWWRVEFPTIGREKQASTPGEIYLTPTNPTTSFNVGPGVLSPRYTYPPNLAPGNFDIFIVGEDCGTVVINGKYRVEGACADDIRLSDSRGAGPVKPFEPIVSYQVVGPATGLVKTTW